MPPQLEREAIHWVASEVAEYLFKVCNIDANPQYAPALADVWNYILKPFFDGSPVGDGSHGKSLSYSGERTVVWVPIGTLNMYFLRIQGVCSAIAYVFSTLLQTIPQRKYRMFTAIFAHFCRVAPVGLRPNLIHVIWLTGDESSPYPRTSQDEHPIILIDGAIYVRDDGPLRSGNTQSFKGPGYRIQTLSDLLASAAPEYMSVATEQPSCACAIFLAAAWYLNHCRPVTCVTFDYQELLRSLKQYKNNEIKFSQLKDSALPLCNSCKPLVNRLQLDYNEIVAQCDLHDSPSRSDHQTITGSPGRPGTRRQRSDSTRNYAAAGSMSGASAFGHLTFSPPDMGLGLPFSSPVPAAGRYSPPMNVPNSNLYAMASRTGVHYPIPPSHYTPASGYLSPGFVLPQVGGPTDDYFSIAAYSRPAIYRQTVGRGYAVQGNGLGIY